MDALAVSRAPRAWLLLLALALALLPRPADAWWNEDWRFRKQILVDVAVPALAAGAGSQDVVVPIRLHPGNFEFFGDALANGDDIRFVAADDQTPLDHRIERIDGATGVAVLWVRIPAQRLAQQERHVWMYYGNAGASPPSGSTVADAATVLSFDFAETSGPPRDATAFGTNAQTATATSGVPAVVDLGLGFAAGSGVSLPPSPALQFVPAQGFSVSAWMKVDGGSAEGRVYAHAGADGSIELRAGPGRITAVVTHRGQPAVVEAPLAADAWHSIAATFGGRTVLFVDGREVASAALPMPALNGLATLGGSGGAPGFTGTLDVLRLANTQRPAGWFRLDHELQRPDSTLLTYGVDESRSGGGWQQELTLIRQLMGSVTIDGWIVIALIAVLGLLSADVLVRKVRLVGRTEHGDAAFLAGFAAGWQEDRTTLATGGTPARARADLDREPSTLARLYGVALAEAAALPVVQGRRECGAESLEVLRGALDARLVGEAERLQRRLVLMTIAVSGGPFLGLLGTVVGVMITFASVAASGDVNVSTIAPGIAAALFATVMGLLVAIPSLFGYNFVATRISARIAAMEVFADQMISRVNAALGAGVARPGAVAHAA